MTSKTLSLLSRLNSASAEGQRILDGIDVLIEERGTLIDERLRLLRDLVRSGRDLHDRLSDFVPRRG
jgi:hypothetical protein